MCQMYLKPDSKANVKVVLLFRGVTKELSVQTSTFPLSTFPRRDRCSRRVAQHITKLTDVQKIYLVNGKSIRYLYFYILTETIRK